MVGRRLCRVAVEHASGEASREIFRHIAGVVRADAWLASGSLKRRAQRLDPGNLVTSRKRGGRQRQDAGRMLLASVPLEGYGKVLYN